MVIGWVSIQLQIYKNEYNKFLQHVHNKLKCQSIITQNKIKKDYTKAYHNKVTNNKFIVKMSWRLVRTRDFFNLQLYERPKKNPSLNENNPVTITSNKYLSTAWVRKK